MNGFLGIWHHHVLHNTKGDFETWEFEHVWFLKSIGHRYVKMILVCVRNLVAPKKISLSQGIPKKTKRQIQLVDRWTLRKSENLENENLDVLKHKQLLLNQSYV